MEEHKKGSKPCYKRELSIYERETLKKIEDFRSARSSWIAESASPKMYSKVTEGFKETNAYQGRNESKTFYEDDSKLDAAGSRAFEMRGLKFLRKFKISTKNIRIHYKTLRPLRYYTLRPELFYTEEMETQIEKKPEPKKEKFTCSDLQLWPTDEPPASLDVSSRKKKKLKRKKAKCKELLMPLPCRDALKKLKAAKLQENMIESCRCDDGKEVTVVIKGICLCDKTSLNHLKLDKVCDEYSRKVASSDKGTNQPQEKQLPAPAHKVESKPQHTDATKAQKTPCKKAQKPIQDETVTIRAVSSLDLHKKRIKSVTESVASKGPETSEEKSKKSVVFDKEEYNKPEEKRKITDSDLTIYPRHSIQSVDSTTEKPQPGDDTKSKTRKQEEKSEVTSELRVKSSIEIFKKQRRNLNPETVSLKTKSENDLSIKQNVSGAIGTERLRDSVKSINQGTKSTEETDTKDDEKMRKDGGNNENSSSITLYRNKPEDESDFALTPEQMEVIKQNENNQK